MDVCARFHADPTHNPRTGRMIKKDGPTYKELVKECGEPPASKKEIVKSQPSSPKIRHQSPNRPETEAKSPARTIEPRSPSRLGKDYINLIPGSPPVRVKSPLPPPPIKRLEKVDISSLPDVPELPPRVLMHLDVKSEDKVAHKLPRVFPATPKREPIFFPPVPTEEPVAKAETGETGARVEPVIKGKVKGGVKSEPYQAEINELKKANPLVPSEDVVNIVKNYIEFIQQPDKPSLPISKQMFTRMAKMVKGERLLYDDIFLEKIYKKYK